MKKIIILIFMLTFYNVMGQNYKIEYQVILNDDDGFLKNENTKSLYLEAIEGAKYLKFNLTCNKNISKFSLEEYLETDLNKTRISLIFTELKKKLYTVNDTIYYNNDIGLFEANKFLIIEPQIKNWTLTTETKKINNYTCYKATTEYVVVNPKGRFVHPIIAWYCPEIPIPSGPNGYGGLPGLILEIQIKKTLLGATKIVKTDEEIYFDLNGEKITKEELEKKYIEFRNSNKF